MADVNGRNILVAFKAQPVLGTPTTGAGASVFRYSGGGGLSLTKDKIRSSESRSDGMSTLGRHGHRSTGGGYGAPLSLGTFDALIAALIRGNWDAGLTITQATAGLTSITTVADGIVAAAGSWITAGLRVGDVFRLTGHAQAANNGRNLRIVGLTALKITTAETLTVDAVADATFTITRPKKVITGSPLVNQLFTFEEREEDQDASLLFPDIAVSGLRLRLADRGEVSGEWSFVGRDKQVLEAAASPNFTSPVPTASLGLVTADAAIVIGNDIAVPITSFDLNFTIPITTQPVVGTLVPRGPYWGNLQPITGTISAVRSDMELVKKFLNETQMSLQLLLVEPDSEPKDFISIFLPLLTLDGNTRNLGQDGPAIQTIPFEAGKQLVAGNTDLTMAAFQSSAA